MTFLIETFLATGQFPYVVIHHPDGRVWNQTLNAGAGGWEAYDGGHWAAYAVALTEQAGSGYYSAAYPAAIVDILTTEVLYLNATPTLGDVPAGGTQSQGVSLAAVFGDSSVATKMQASLASMVRGVVAAGTLTTTAFTTNLTNTSANAYRGRSVLFATGDLAGQGGVISEYDPATGKLTVTGAFTEAPAAADVFVIA
jgi:hypothetical protein